MVIFTDSFIPYEFENKRKCYEYIVERSHGIKKSLKFIEMDAEHLKVRCPVSGDYLEIIGSEEDLNWLHSELTKKEIYKLGKSF